MRECSMLAAHLFIALTEPFDKSPCQISLSNRLFQPKNQVSTLMKVINPAKMIAIAASEPMTISRLIVSGRCVETVDGKTIAA